MEDERRVGAGRNGFTWSERSGDMECRGGDRHGTGLAEVVSGIGAAVGLVVGKLEHCARGRRLALERFLSIGRWGALGVLVGPVACATKAPHRVDRGTAPSLPWSTIMRLSGHSRWAGPCWWRRSRTPRSVSVSSSTCASTNRDGLWWRLATSLPSPMRSGARVELRWRASCARMTSFGPRSRSRALPRRRLVLLTRTAWPRELRDLRQSGACFMGQVRLHSDAGVLC